MLKVEYTTQFKRDLKLAKKRNKDMAVLQQIMKKLNMSTLALLKLV